MQHEDQHCSFCNIHIPRFLYILVSYTVTVNPWQSSDWYHQTAYYLQGDVNFDYLWLPNSFCTDGSTHQQCLGESQGHPIYILQDLRGVGNIFGKHYWRQHQQYIRKVLHRKWSFPLRLSSVNVTKSQFSAEEILNGRLYFLCSEVATTISLCVS